MPGAISVLARSSCRDKASFMLSDISTTIPFDGKGDALSIRTISVMPNGASNLPKFVVPLTKARSSVSRSNLLTGRSGGCHLSIKVDSKFDVIEMV